MLEILLAHFGFHSGFKSDQRVIKLNARGATVAPKGDRQIQIKAIGFLEAAQTANQQTVPNLTPKTIKIGTQMEQKRTKEPPKLRQQLRFL